jgi:hypothetical protein
MNQPEIGSGHDAMCERELTSHGYTQCRCDERKPVRCEPRADVLQALKPFAYAYESLMQEAHDALQVGGYVPTEDSATTEVPIGWLRLAHEVIAASTKET